MEALPGLPPIPRGFQAQMTTDGASYAFSLKDTLDPCRFAYFSDQDGVVYLVYFTAWDENSRLQTRPDVYGHDRKQRMAAEPQ